MTTILTEAFVIGEIALMVSSGIFAISAFSLAKTGTILVHQHQWTKSFMIYAIKCFALGTMPVRATAVQSRCEAEQKY